MQRRNNIVLLIILIIFAFTLWAILPVNGERFGRKVRLGLDLVGGVHLVYQAQFSENATSADKNAAMERALLTIQKRIDTYGVTEPVIQKLGEDRILVQLPGFTDIEAAKRLVEQTGFLEFREVELNEAGKPVYLSDYLSGNITAFFNKKETGKRLFTNDVSDKKESGKPIAFLVKDESGLHFTDMDGNPIDRETLKTGPVQVPAWIPSRGDNGTPLTGAYLSDASPNLSTGVAGAQAEVNIKWNAGRERNLRPDCQAPLQSSGSLLPGARPGHLPGQCSHFSSPDSGAGIPWHRHHQRQFHDRFCDGAGQPVEIRVTARRAEETAALSGKGLRHTRG